MSSQQVVSSPSTANASTVSAVSKFYDLFVLRNRWIPKWTDPKTGRWGPSIKQAEFLCRGEREGMFGGAARGGKSFALLAAATRFVNESEYNAILFRRHLTDHKLSGGLIEKSLEWWSNLVVGGKKAHWNAVDFKWDFPSGATLQFGFLEALSDRQRYASTEFHFCGFDESTQFEENDYTFMSSRLCKRADCWIPLQIRCASNPGDIGHDWVKRRFITEGVSGGRFFIPADLRDNNFIDQDEYEKSLSVLDFVTRSRLQFGDWDIAAQGNVFKYAWFVNDNLQLGPRRNQVVSLNDVPSNARRVRFWDKAATEPEKGRDPDWTAGVLLAESGGRYWVVDVTRFRGTPSENERRIRSIAESDGAGTTQYIEQEPGSSGKDDVFHYSTGVLKGLPCLGVRSTGDKLARANPLSTACENGHVYLVKSGWVEDFINELCQFPGGAHDDQVDGASGAFRQLSRVRGIVV